MELAVYDEAIEAGREKGREMAAGQIGAMVETFGFVAAQGAVAALECAITRGSAAAQWRQIDERAKHPANDARKRQVLLIAAYPMSGGGIWSDVYHSWWDDRDKKWARWPHDFPPTHYQDVVPPSGW